MMQNQKRWLGISRIIWNCTLRSHTSVELQGEGVNKYLCKLLFVYMNYLYSASYDMVDSLLVPRSMGYL